MSCNENISLFCSRKSFEIIKNNNNKSPVIFREKSLVLASWCIKPLYFHVYSRLLETKQNHTEQLLSTSVSRWLLGALLLNPDVCTFWNMRRKLIQNEILDPILDLHIVDIIICRRSQCTEAYSYKRWLLKVLLNSDRGIPNIHLLFHDEYQITTMAATSNSSNFHAWTQRKYITTIVQQMFDDELSKNIDEEWKKTAMWCSSHISDHSGFVYRQYILKCLFFQTAHHAKKYTKVHRKQCYKIISKFVSVTNERCYEIHISNHNHNQEIQSFIRGENFEIMGISFQKFLINLSFWAEDFLLNEELINLFPGHESLWYHRRFLVVSFYALLDKANATDSNSLRYRNEKVGGNSFNEDGKSLKTTLKMALRIRNRNIVSFSQVNGNHLNALAEAFSNFLIRNDEELQGPISAHFS